MSHSEEIWHRPIIKSIKDRGQFTRSNKIIGNFGKIAKEQVLCISYSTLQRVRDRDLNLTKY